MRRPTKFKSGYLKRRDGFGRLGAEVRIILKRFLQRQADGVYLFHLALYRIHWRVLTNTEISFDFHRRSEIS
jgi:hypothetical protein